MHKVYYTLVGDEKMYGLKTKKKQKFVAVATLLKRSQPSLTAIIYA